MSYSSSLKLSTARLWSYSSSLKLSTVGAVELQQQHKAEQGWAVELQLKENTSWLVGVRAVQDEKVPRDTHFLQGCQMSLKLPHIAAACMIAWPLLWERHAPFLGLSL